MKEYRLDVVSDTRWPEQRFNSPWKAFRERFRGRILHAGDRADPAVVDALSTVAPV